LLSGILTSESNSVSILVLHWHEQENS